MIAQRLRPIGWVASVAGAALSFYLVSLQVAAERASLETVERKIEFTKRDIRRLETEFAARASLPQLEAYNGEVLALTAPTAKQYLTNEVQLASFDPNAMGPGAGSPPGRTALASLQTAPAAPVATPAAAPARPTLKPAVVTDAKIENAPVVPAARRQPVLQAVAYVEPIAPVAKPIAKAAKPAARIPAVEKVAMLDSDTLGDIARRAAKEAKAAKR
jgi:hypothetical protein